VTRGRPRGPHFRTVLADKEILLLVDQGHKYLAIKFQLGLKNVKCVDNAVARRRKFPGHYLVLRGATLGILRDSKP